MTTFIRWFIRGALLVLIIRVISTYFHLLKKGGNPTFNDVMRETFTKKPVEIPVKLKKEPGEKDE